MMYPYMKEKKAPLSLTEKKQAILRCITAGMLDALYAKYGYATYRDKTDDRREKGRESTTSDHKIITAEPKNIEFINRRGRKDQVNILTNTTKAEPSRLEELAPHLVTKEQNTDKRNTNQQKVIYQEDMYFNGLKVGDRDLESPLSDKGILLFCDALANGNVKSQQEKLTYIYI
ncbi:MAG: hypothetical protein LBG52_04540 [Candidatus Peribacteria bacterium]|nr:hypothetical protein [Candidatus Peribacteria bacterium]